MSSSEPKYAHGKPAEGLVQAAEVDPALDNWPEPVVGGGKIKKRITFYQYNRETRVEEVRLLSVASGLVGVSTEDFIRGCALERAARIVIVEQRKQIEAQKKSEMAETAEQATTEGVPAADAVVSDSNTQPGNEVANGVVGQAESREETGATAEASGAAAGLAQE